MPILLRQPKVSIIGAGSVGATIAYACLIRGAANTVALHDLDADKVRAEVLDLNQGIQFVPMAQVVGSEDVEVTADSDLVVVTAGAKQKPGQTRLELAGINVEMCRTLLPRLVELSPDATVLMVTNPVDVLTYAATKFTGLPPSRVIGSGTVLDTSRLRILLSQRTGVAVQSVHAYIVGEHGDSELPLWSSASIGPMPVTQWVGADGLALDEAFRAETAEQVVRSAEMIIRGKGATNYAIGLSTARIVEALIKDEGRILPVSSLMNGQYGITDICLSLPTVVGSHGVSSVLTPPLSDDELDALRHSADTVKGVARSLGL
jgi:L-lactate dehydrogenase